MSDLVTCLAYLAYLVTYLAESGIFLKDFSAVQLAEEVFGKDDELDPNELFLKKYLTKMVRGGLNLG